MTVAIDPSVTADSVIDPVDLLSKAVSSISPHRDTIAKFWTVMAPESDTLLTRVLAASN
ncbi:hypothetical protein ABIE89_004747 [Bradyrhizobium niftali]|uniref:hypothetical protein n=1 Tax=Bradyrhizobium niftali TaxID=2560055 RepID=UPI0038329CCE